MAGSRSILEVDAPLDSTEGTIPVADEPGSTWCSRAGARNSLTSYAAATRGTQISSAGASHVAAECSGFFSQALCLFF